MSVPAAMLPATKDLQTLLRGIAAAPAVPLTDISSDSRLLAAGGLFIACQGASSHGLDFLAQAEAAGVAAVIFDPATAAARPAAVPLVPVADLARHVGTLADRWFDAPTATLEVSGVTGTNGKTTIAWLLRQVLQLSGSRSAYVGTLGAGLDTLADTGMTTPACVEMHRLLAGYRDAGATAAAVEVSSHALAQGRVDGMRFHTALFTNLSRDHIDYHGSMRAYGETKARLFLEFETVHRIVCTDSEFGRELAARIGPDAVTVASGDLAGAAGERYVAVRSIDAAAGGSRVAFASAWGDGEVLLPLPGEFNVANGMQVLAAMLCRGMPLDEALAVLAKVSAPPGRMQRLRVTAKTPLPAVYVDYAHTPASLEVALRALRRHCAGRLWCVFGCGGDRDRGKRRMMGEIAARLADAAVVTNDNPRSEPPQQIFDEILAGMSGDALVLEDRGAAIAHAVGNAAPEDIVLLAGKGHEACQVIGSRVLEFSDHDVAAACLRDRAGDSA